MTETSHSQRVEELFSDARALHEDALEMLAQGKIRNAAEKAWGATKRATDGLILARTGREPNRTPQTSAGIRALGQDNETLASLRSRYSETAHYLHGDCFYDGHCEPEEFVTELIRSVTDYIRTAQDSANRP